jgi:hypothetical protein
MAIDPVIIDFAVRGMADVSKAFETVESRIAKLERQSTAGTASESRKRIAAAQSETTAREKSSAKLAASVKKDEKAAGKAVSDEAKKAAKEAERLEAYKLRMRIRSSEMAGRYAARQAAEEVRAAQRATDAWGRVGRRTGAIAGGTIGRLTSGLGGMASATMGIGSGVLVADAIKRQLSAERSAALLVNSATIGGKPAAGATTENILGQASQVSKMTGLDKTDLIASVQNYVAKSSDFEGGMANMGFFAKLAKGSGSSLEDITGAAGILRAQNKNLSAADMRQMLLDIVEQGKQGAVEINDLAHLAGGLGATRGLYAGSQTENQRKLLALSQITRTESESPEEAATSVKDLGIEALNGKHRSALAAMGVQFTKGGQIGSLEDLIEKSLIGTGGDLGKLEGLFGARGVKTFMRLAPIFNAAGGGEKGIAAVNAEMGPIMNARGSMAQMDQAFSIVMSTPAEKFATALNSLITTIEDKAEPYLRKFADVIGDPMFQVRMESIIDEAGKLAAWFADNPIKGIGAVVLAAVTKDLAGAGIGEAVKFVLMKLLGGVGASLPAGIGGGGKAIGVAGAIGIVGATAALALGGKELIDAHTAGISMANAQGIAGSNVGANVASELSSKTRMGAVTPADIARAQSAAAGLQSQLAKEKSDMPSAWNPLSIITGGDNQRGAQGQIKNTEMALDALTRAIRGAVAAVNASAASETKTNPARELPMDARNRTGS